MITSYLWKKKQKKSYKEKDNDKTKKLRMNSLDKRMLLIEQSHLNPFTEDYIEKLRIIPRDIQNKPDINQEKTIQEYRDNIWKNTSQNYIDIYNNNNNLDISIKRFWSLTNNQMELTEQHIQHAQNVINDNHTHEDMPKF